MNTENIDVAASLLAYRTTGVTLMGSDSVQPQQVMQVAREYLRLKDERERSRALYNAHVERLTAAKDQMERERVTGFMPELTADYAEITPEERQAIKDELILPKPKGWNGEWPPRPMRLDNRVSVWPFVMIISALVLVWAFVYMVQS